MVTVKHKINHEHESSYAPLYTCVEILARYPAVFPCCRGPGTVSRGPVTKRRGATHANRLCSSVSAERSPPANDFRTTWRTVHVRPLVPARSEQLHRNLSHRAWQGRATRYTDQLKWNTLKVSYDKFEHYYEYYGVKKWLYAHIIN